MLRGGRSSRGDACSGGAGSLGVSHPRACWLVGAAVAASGVALSGLTAQRAWFGPGRLSSPVQAPSPLSQVPLTGSPTHLDIFLRLQLLNGLLGGSQALGLQVVRMMARKTLSRMSGAPLRAGCWAQLAGPAAQCSGLSGTDSSPLSQSP